MKKDRKGRRLKEGEKQRKNGLYEFRFTDPNTGERESVYSWRLLKTDKNPSATHVSDESLREMEDRIFQAIESGADTIFERDMTLNDFFDEINDLRTVKATTRDTYRYSYDTHIRYTFLGRMSLRKIRRLHITKLYNDILNGESGKPLRVSSLGVINSCLSSLFKEAIMAEQISLNPTTGVYSDIKRSHNYDHLATSISNDSIVKQQKSLNKLQQERFFEHLKSNLRWVDCYLELLLFLAYTGCRIGEASAITWHDINFQSKEIIIRRTLSTIKNRTTGKSETHLTSPKSACGIRIIPMNDILYQCLKNLHEVQQSQKNNQICVDGVSGFVFLGPRGGLLVRSTVDRAIISIAESYNKQEVIEAAEEKREPVLIPHITAHSFRHTFCSLFLQANPSMIKELQELAGHCSAGFTLTTYADSLGDSKKDAMNSMRDYIGITLPVKTVAESVRI